MNSLLFALADVLQWVIFAYRIIVIASAVVSWVNADPSNPIVQFLRAMTEPVFRALRQRMPFLVVNGYDLSPIGVLLILMFLERLLFYVRQGF